MLILINRGKSFFWHFLNSPALSAFFKLKPLKNERRKCQKNDFKRKIAIKLPNQEN